MLSKSIVFDFLKPVLVLVLIDTSDISCLRLLVLLFKVSLFTPTVLVLIVFPVNLLLYPPSSSWELDPRTLNCGMLPPALLKEWKLSNHELAKTWIRHLGTGKIEKHMATDVFN